MKNLIFILPAYNEEKTIANVIRKIKIYGDILIIDDGSIDKTSLYGKINGARVISKQKNEGYDAAINDGIKQAIKEKYKYLITIDADDQFDLNDIKLFIKLIDEKNIDLIIGIRPKIERISEKIYAYFYRIKWGINDPLCGLKAYKIENLYPISNPKKSKNQMGLYYLNKVLINKNLEIIQPLISLNPRLGKSKIGGVLKANLIIIYTLINNILTWKQ